ncbi:hypothetical protein [Brevibacillus reuszeri]|uniref:hypothetical protein n=1 Tax=Brevibacillus reuszeri TaxID=54915 RepID=UPI000CCC07FE|nr:hypothetical protein [Brevibacillus reuszeri]
MMKSNNAIFKIVLSCSLLSACSSTQEAYSIPSAEALELDTDTVDKLIQIHEIAREDAQEIGYPVTLVSLPIPSTIYQDGKPLGAYLVKVASKSKKHPEKDLIILYYFSIQHELLVRIPLGENEELIETNTVRPKNIHF